MREENGTGPEYSGEEAVLPPAGSFILSPSPHVLGGETIPVLWGEEPRKEAADKTGRAFYFQGGDANPAIRLRLTYR